MPSVLPGTSPCRPRSIGLRATGKRYVCGRLPDDKGSEKGDGSGDEVDAHVDVSTVLSPEYQ